MGLNDEAEKIRYARDVIGDQSKPLFSNAVQAALDHLMYVRQSYVPNPQVRQESG